MLRICHMITQKPLHMLKIPFHFLVLATLLAITCLLQGCTATMWHQTPFTLKDPVLQGVRIVSDGHGAEQAYLIVAYKHHKRFFDGDHGFEVDHYAIPLENGHPPAELTTSNAVSTPPEILTRLEKKQLKRIAHHRFSWKEHKLAEKPPKESRFIKVIEAPSVNPKRGPRVDGVDSSYDRDGVGVCWIDYRWNGEELRCDKPLGSESKILLLPSRQRRFLREQGLTYARSICLTPFTVVFDAGLFVVGLGMEAYNAL